MKLLSVARAAAFFISSSDSINNKDSTALSVGGRSLLQRLTIFAAEQRGRGLQDAGADQDAGDDQGGDEDEGVDEDDVGDEDEGFDEDEGLDEDEEEDNSIFFNEELKNTVTGAMDYCDIDLDSLSLFEDDDLDLDLELFQYYAKLFPGVCNDKDEVKFKSALDTFQTCSSFDLVGALENLDDALVGAAFECALVSAPALLEMTNATELDDFELPYQCSEAFLGRNPLGNMIRNTVLYPDKILPCFTSLNLAIPHCTLEAWPLPVVGPILKRIACFVGRGKYFLETVSAQNLAAFDECLPELDEEINEEDCDSILYECQYIDETEFLLPVPFSDLTVRVAQESGLSHVVTRYENFFDKCEYERWEGWKYTSKNFNFGTSYGDEIPEPSFDDSSNEGNSSIASSGQSLEASTKAKNTSGGTFGWGFFAGVLAASFVWSVVILLRAFVKRGRMLREFDAGKPNYTDSTGKKPSIILSKGYADNSAGKPSINLNAVRDAEEDFSHTEDSTDHHDEFNTVHFT